MSWVVGRSTDFIADTNLTDITDVTDVTDVGGMDVVGGTVVT